LPIFNIFPIPHQIGLPFFSISAYYRHAWRRLTVPIRNLNALLGAMLVGLAGCAATFWRPNGRNLNKSSTKGRDEDEWGVTPDKGYDLKLSKKEENDLFEHQRDSEIIRGGPAPSSEFRDRQLEMALEYLRGQIKTASRKEAGRDVDNR